MPDVLAEVRKGWVAGRGARFLDAIHAAIVEALHTPEDDKVLRLVEHPPEHFAIPGSGLRAICPYRDYHVCRPDPGGQARALQGDRQKSRTVRRAAERCEDYPDRSIRRERRDARRRSRLRSRY